MSASGHQRGVRFAPSPTGRFHVGNLRTAWISREISRLLGEPWIVRFEDIDRPRVVSGAKELQLEDLGALGLVPDLVLTQSDFEGRHWEALLPLIREGEVYPCFCTRKEVEADLQSIASAPHGRPAQYSGKCRRFVDRERGSPPSIAWRIRMPREDGTEDFIVARTSPVLAEDGTPGERKTFQAAYNWACAIDDLDGGYRWIVRARDLEPVLEPQRLVQKRVARRDSRGTPGSLVPASAFHCALVTREDGGRLEKRTKGVTLPELSAAGYGPERLLAAFRRSLEPGLLERLMKEPPGSSCGEALSIVRLGELGIGS